MKSNKKGSLEKQTSIKKNNNQLWLGFIIGSLLTLVIMLMHQGYLPVTIPFLLGVLFSVVVIILVGVLGLYFYRKKLMRRWFGKEVDVDIAVEDLQQGIQSVVSKVVDVALIGVDANKKEDIKRLLPRFVNHVLFAQLRNWGLRLSVTLIAALGGLLGTILLFHQNQLLTNQNEKIDKQILLEEASRRSSLNFLLANVLDEIDEELDDPKNTKRKLSSQLIGRISSLSQSFQPYRFIDGDTMISRPLSPERGSLLLALAKSDINTASLDEICGKTIFWDVVLNNSMLQGAHLNTIVLKGANLRKTNFTGANLFAAYLVEADLREVNFTGADLIGTWFINSNLSGAVFADANLGAANFQGAKGITVEQLQAASSLVGTMGIPDSIVFALKQKKPSLFENINSPPSRK